MDDTTNGKQKAHIERSAYIWNTAGGMLMAFQSVIMLVVLTRVCSVYDAGVFTLAYANACMFLNIGNFGMRKFQVSDRNEQFRFAVYRGSRVFTVISMLSISTAYLVWSATTLSYSAEKTVVIAVMCAFKAIDAIEDIYFGRYQQQGRLDIAARVMTLRIGTTIALFAITVAAMRSLAIPLIISTVYDAAFLTCEVSWVRNHYGMPKPIGKFSFKSMLRLLKTCLPLAAADFLLFYVGNAPKYAIDAFMDDAAQAYYGYIAMPIFIVTLLASFVYNPMIVSLSEKWRMREVDSFLAAFAKLTFIIVAITAICVAAAAIVGPPILGILYVTDMEPYRLELCILVTGGGFLAIVTLATLGITIMRLQRILVPLYAGGAIIAWSTSGWAVNGWGIPGACWCYLSVTAVMALAFVIAFAIGARMITK